MSDLFRRISQVFTGTPDSLPDAPHQAPPQAPPLQINSAEELLAAANNDPARILQILRDQQEVIHANEHEIATAKERQAALEAAQRPNGVAFVQPNYDDSRKKSAKAPDPDKYDGERENLRAFVFDLKYKLRNNSDWYANEQEMVAYSVGRLEKVARKRILPLVESPNSPQITTMPMFYEALETTCGDPDRKATAQRYIQTLKQANRPFIQYLADFEANVYDTGFDEDNQRFYLKEGLSSELRQLLIPTQAHTLSFAELKKLCQRMDNEQRQFKPFVPKARTTPGTTTTATTPFVPARPSAPAQLTVNKSTNDSGTAMDLSIINQAARPRGPITPEVRQYRMDNKLCLYTGCLGPG